MVERTGHCTFLSLHYEWIPDYCQHCNVIGHAPANCRWQKPKDFSREADDTRRGRLRETKVLLGEREL